VRYLSGMFKTAFRSLGKVVIIVRFEPKLELTRFSKTVVSHFKQICPMGLKLECGDK
jgi:hypothetical protein